jgi:hypothetical protein
MDIDTITKIAGGFVAGAVTVVTVMRGVFADRERGARGRAMVLSDVVGIYLTVDVQARLGAIWHDEILGPAVVQLRTRLDGPHVDGLSADQIRLVRDALRETEIAHRVMLQVLAEDPGDRRGQALAEWYDSRRGRLRALFASSRQTLANARISLGDITPIAPLDPGGQ